MAALRRALAPRPVMSTQRLVAVTSVLLAEDPTAPIRLPAGRHRAPRGVRPVIGECTPPSGMPGRWVR